MSRKPTPDEQRRLLNERDDLPDNTAIAEAIRAFLRVRLAR